MDGDMDVFHLGTLWENREGWFVPLTSQIRTGSNIVVAPFVSKAPDVIALEFQSGKTHVAKSRICPTSSIPSSSPLNVVLPPGVMLPGSTLQEVSPFGRIVSSWLCLPDSSWSMLWRASPQPESTFEKSWTLVQLLMYVLTAFSVFGVAVGACRLFGFRITRVQDKPHFV